MLKSGLNIKSAQISVQPPESHSDEEVAACIAAIYTIIDGSQSQPLSDSQASNWLSSGRCHSAGRRANHLGGSTWRMSGLPVVLLLMLVSLLSLPAGAQESEASDPAPTVCFNNANARPVVSDSDKHIYIKVGLCLGASKVQLEAIDGASIRDVRNGQLMANLTPRTEWQVSVDPAKHLCFKGKTNSDLATAGDAAGLKPVAYFPSAPRLFYNQLKFDCKPAADDDSVNGYLVVPPNGTDSVVGLNGKLYRGALWLKFTPAAVDGKPVAALNAINIVEVDDYLLSVLPAEMPASWPTEALKAQAVAARSYAIANIGKHAHEGYDVKATIDDQVYSGVANENASSNAAVAQTAGLILKHKGKPVSAFFHSTSGGATEVAENVWGRPVPYLKSVPDYDDSSPHFSWTRQIKVEDLEKAVTPSVGQVTSLIVVNRTASNRVKDALVVGTNGAHFISGQALRHLFKLPSTNFNVGYKQNCYELAGRGFGHGLGMSQWGAKSLAEQGYNAAQILTYYYKDVTIEYSAELPGI